MADFREFLQEGTFLERKALIHNFATGIEIVEDEAGSAVNCPHAVGRCDARIGACRQLRLAQELLSGS